MARANRARDPVVDALEPGTLVRARAPVRLSFGGGGTELPSYANQFGGVVLNATISHFLHATLAVTAEEVVFSATEHATEETFPADAVKTPSDHRLHLHHAVYCHMMEKFNDGVPLPLRLTTFSDVPTGSGLGSSSSLTVALVKAFDESFGLLLSAAQIAEMARSIERDQLGLSGGSQDHYAAALGGINYFTFNTDGTVQATPMNLDPGVVAELEHSLVLYYTGSSRQSANIIDDQARKIDEADKTTLEALHKIKELANSMRSHIESGNQGALAADLHASWLAKRATSSSVSNPQLDEIYEAALAAGALGGKISGAGGGGFMMLLCDPCRRGALLNALPGSSSQDCHCSLTTHGAQAWRVPIGAY